MFYESHPQDDEPHVRFYTPEEVEAHRLAAFKSQQEEFMVILINKLENPQLPMVPRLFYIR